MLVKQSQFTLVIARGCTAQNKVSSIRQKGMQHSMEALPRKCSVSISVSGFLQTETLLVRLAQVMELPLCSWVTWVHFHIYDPRLWSGPVPAIVDICRVKQWIRSPSLCLSAFQTSRSTLRLCDSNRDPESFKQIRQFK